MTRDEHTTNRPIPGGSAFQETGMDDYLTRVAEAVRKLRYYGEVTPSCDDNPTRKLMREAADLLAAAPEAPQTIQCNACDWIGSSADARYLGGRGWLGPLCPECGETTGPADDAATLRSAIRDMASMLQAREWAEHVSTSADPDVTDLEVQITELVGTATKLREQNATLVAELLTLYQGYVNLLKSGRDRIIALGGDCDPVGVMERNDPWLISARNVLASVKGGAS